jgi:hypothetical protein
MKEKERRDRGQGMTVVAWTVNWQSDRRKGSDSFIDVCLLSLKGRIQGMALHIFNLHALVNACTVVQRL